MLGVIEESKIQAMELLGTSMLKNICNYGISGRQTVTNDLSLPIALNPTSETITIGNSGWATFTSDRYLDFGSVPGLEAFIATGNDASSVNLESIGIVPPMTGIVLRGTEGTYTVNATDGVPGDVSRNKLSANLLGSIPAAGSYVLSKKNGIVGFYKLSSGISIPGKKAYIPNTNSSGAKTRIGIR